MMAVARVCGYVVGCHDRGCIISGRALIDLPSSGWLILREDNCGIPHKYTENMFLRSFLAGACVYVCAEVANRKYGFFTVAL